MVLREEVVLGHDDYCVGDCRPLREPRDVRGRGVDEPPSPRDVEDDVLLLEVAQVLVDLRGDLVPLVPLGRPALSVLRRGRGGAALEPLLDVGQNVVRPPLLSLAPVQGGDDRGLRAVAQEEARHAGYEDTLDDVDALEEAARFHAEPLDGRHRHHPPRSLDEVHRGSSHVVGRSGGRDVRAGNRVITSAETGDRHPEPVGTVGAGEVHGGSDGGVDEVHSPADHE
mmetsp:Transcript_13960/g.25589  ORF Transcript_13960/g.25589 Transcript_13960/m.25589 type:complete len:226 (+) Transcript_13960:938-1615(+)